MSLFIARNYSTRNYSTRNYSTLMSSIFSTINYNKTVSEMVRERLLGATNRPYYPKKPLQSKMNNYQLNNG